MFKHYFCIGFTAAPAFGAAVGIGAPGFPFSIEPNTA